MVHQLVRVLVLVLILLELLREDQVTQEIFEPLGSLAPFVRFYHLVNSGIGKLLGTTVVEGLAGQIRLQVHLIFVSVHPLADYLLIVAVVEVDVIVVLLLVEVCPLPHLGTSNLGAERLLGFSLAHYQAWRLDFIFGVLLIVS